MRLLFSTFLTLFLAIGISNAQVTPQKAFKNAKKQFSKYWTNQEKAELLTDAMNSIDAALEDSEMQANPKVWNMKGKIYNAIINKDAIALLTSKTYEVENPKAGLEAFSAYKMAIEKATKKYQKKEALKGLQETANNLANVGNYFIEKKDFATAYDLLQAIVDIRAIHKDAGMKTLLDTEKDLNDHLFIVGYCAMKSGKKDEAKATFNKLMEANYDEPRIYSFAFDLADNDEDALKILEKGKEKYPANSEIMFSEINYYIKKGDFASLKSKLEKAIEKNPDNPSLYSALGNVFMNLFQDEYGKGNEAQAKTYFDDSKKYFEKALELKPDMFDVNYNIGSLYYNKAVEVTKKMNALPISETKKYDALKGEMEGLFNTALPYFKKAESLNANDQSTLIALKEIFARLNDFEKSNEFKKRFQAVKDGEKLESYFK